MRLVSYGFWREILVCAAVLAVLALGGPWDADAGEKDLPGLGLGEMHSAGDPIRLDNLVVFPIYSSVHEDVGEFETLAEAIAGGRATVREVGADPTPPPPQPSLSRRLLQKVLGVNEEAEEVQQVQLAASGAMVGTLVIQNTGNKAILVLAGTVVKGGKQDRQVGQDFVVGPKQTVPVDAFCVEHGRWDAQREGEATGGQFGSVGILANRSVRMAGQYKKDQGKVWENVAKVNNDNSKGAATGTLMATMDDPEVKERMGRLIASAEKALDALTDHTRIAGLAYAVDGRVHGARWFVNHDMYVKFRPVLLSTMAMEAITAQNIAKTQGKPLITIKVPPKAVRSFVKELRKEKVQKTAATKGMNTNAYRENEEGYSSECVIEVKGKKIQFSMDFLAK